MNFKNEMIGQHRVRNIGVGKTINGTAMQQQTFKVVEVLQNGNGMISLVSDNRVHKLTPRVMRAKEMTITEFTELCKN